MSLREKNINALIDLFNTKKSLYLECIQQELNLKERAAKGYIRELREHGIKVSCSKGLYRIDESNGEQSDFSVISKQDLRELKIIHIISEFNGLLTKQGLIKAFAGNKDEYIYISSKTIGRDIEQCVIKRYIYLENQRYYIRQEFRTIHKLEVEQLYKFIDLCSAYSNKMPFYNELNSLKDRLTIEGGYEDYECDIYTIGRKFKENFGINDFLDSMQDIDFRKKVVYLEYNSKKGLIQEDIHIVTFLYSWDKDKSYIVGMVKENTYFVDVDTINLFKEQDEANKYFDNKEIMDKIKAMFGASLDGPYDVRIEFDNVFNIKEKVERLQKNRVNAKVYPIKDNTALIYLDTIYGLRDFANYLRRFGYSCRVIEPKELRDIMLNTYERLLANYEVKVDEK